MSAPQAMLDDHPTASELRALLEHYPGLRAELVEGRIIAATDGPAALADLFALVDAFPGLHAELIDGRIVLMTGSTRRHNTIAGNIFAALHGPMRARGCEVFVSDVIVRRADMERFGAAPDVFVRCGPPAADDGDRLVSDPTVVFEVLSPSTEAADRVRKFLNYQAMPSLAAYVLVRQDEPRVEPWTRDGEILKPQPALSGRDAVLALAALEAELPLAAIYEGVAFG